MLKRDRYFWYGPWTTKCILKDAISPLKRRLTGIRDNAIVSGIIDRWTWLLPTGTLSSLQELWRDLKNIDIGSGCNKLIWTPHPKEKFSIASACEVLRDST